MNDENYIRSGDTRWEAEVGAIYDLVRAAPRVVFQEAGFLLVEPEMVLRILTEVNLAVAGCRHIMDTDSIRHIIKSHAGAKELLRGQIPLVREDFLLLPEVFGSPDTIDNAGKTKPGRDTICYRKRIGEYRYCYFEELRTKKNRLAAVTYYKQKH